MGLEDPLKSALNVSYDTDILKNKIPNNAEKKTSLYVLEIKNKWFSKDEVRLSPINKKNISKWNFKNLTKKKIARVIQENGEISLEVDEKTHEKLKKRNLLNNFFFLSFDANGKKTKQSLNCKVRSLSDEEYSRIHNEAMRTIALLREQLAQQEKERKKAEKERRSRIQELKGGRVNQLKERHHKIEVKDKLPKKTPQTSVRERQELEKRLDEQKIQADREQQKWDEEKEERWEKGQVQQEIKQERRENKSRDALQDDILGSKKPKNRSPDSH